MQTLMDHQKERTADIFFEIPNRKHNSNNTVNKVKR